MKIMNAPQLNKTLLGTAFGALALLGSTNRAESQTVPRIAFQAPVAVDRRTSYSQIFSMNPDGSGKVQLTSASASAPAPRWSPSQQYIAFWRSSTLWVMEAKGESNGGRSFAVALAHNYGSDWSPDGSTLVFQGTNNCLYLVSVNASAGTAGTPVFFHSGSWYNPSWSSDGTRIAANGSDDPSNTDVITVFESATGVDLVYFGASSDYNFAPQWSPDGTHIAFTGPVTVMTTTRRGTTSATYQEIFLANADGTGMTQITRSNSNSYFPSWSPDGTSLAFANDAGGTVSIYNLVLGNNVATLLNSGSNNPDWNP